MRPRSRTLLVLVLAAWASVAAAQGSSDMVVEGLLGSLPPRAVRQAIEARMQDFVGCVDARKATNDMLGGRVAIHFRVGTDGSVRWARVSQSNLGDRVAERCLLVVANRVRFPRPTGGEAEATETLDLPLDPEVRPPLDWSREPRVTDAIRRTVVQLRSRCRVNDGSIRVTAYVAPGGRVLTAGAFASKRELDGAVECVLNGITGLAMPNPGSYPAKTAFDVP